MKRLKRPLLVALIGAVTLSVVAVGITAAVSILKSPPDGAMEGLLAAAGLTVAFSIASFNFANHIDQSQGRAEARQAGEILVVAAAMLAIGAFGLATGAAMSFVPHAVAFSTGVAGALCAAGFGFLTFVVYKHDWE